MTTALLDLIQDALKDLQARSWHETTRRDLGLTDETDGEALLAVTIARPVRKKRPLAFVIDGHQVENTLVAIREYLAALFGPNGFTGHSSAGQAIAVVDFLPPLNEQGHSRGTTRRWVMDGTNMHILMDDLAGFMRVVAKGL